MIFGTCHFETEEAVLQYYRRQGYCTLAMVRDAIKQGEIKIGPPPLEEGELLMLDSDRRYHIQTK